MNVEEDGERWRDEREKKRNKLTCGAIFILSDATECFVYRQATSLSNSPLDLQRK